MSWVEPALGVASTIAGALGQRTKKLPKEVKNLYRFNPADHYAGGARHTSGYKTAGGADSR